MGFANQPSLGYGVAAGLPPLPGVPGFAGGAPTSSNPTYEAPPPGARINAEAQQNIANDTAASAADTARSIQNADFGQNLNEFRTFMNEFGPQMGGSSSTAGAAATGVGTWTPTPISTTAAPTIQAPSSAAMDSANFSRAKDQVGNTANAAIQGLQRAMEARGIAPGSSIEAAQLGSIYDQGLGQLADVSRQNAITDTQTATDLAKANLSAAVTERGQDIGANTAANQAALEARGQDIGANEFSTTNQRESLAALLSAFKGLY